MEVFAIRPDERAQSLVPTNPKVAMEVIGVGGFTGHSMVSRWRPLDFRVDKSSGTGGDFFCLSADAYAFSSRVLAKLNDIFTRVGELLPITIEGEPHYALNVLRRIDALDLARSKIRTLLGKHIIGIDQYEFYEERVQDESIFFIEQQIAGLLTVSGQSNVENDFSSRVREAGFAGLEFRPLWRSG